MNVYWDCYRGVSTGIDRPKETEKDFSFEQVELMYYTAQYSDFIFFQNERNVKNRHPERNRTVEDLLKSKKTCPEETIYQIGTIEESVSPELLLQIVNEFFGEMETRFGSHVHILNWALHLDEGTPHIQERHVFDCKNKYGELEPKQDKALEELGIPLPDPSKPKSKYNNRKQTFDAICRDLLFDICEKHGLKLEREPSYGGRGYLEKQDYIIEKQKQTIATKKQELSEITMKIEDAEALVEEIAENAYEKACEVVADTVRTETQKQDLAVLEDYKEWITSPERNLSQEKKDVIGKCLDALGSKMKNAAGKILSKVQKALKNPEVKNRNQEQVREKAKESLLALLQHKKEQVKRNDDSVKPQQHKKQNMEL